MQSPALTDTHRPTPDTPSDIEISDQNPEKMGDFVAFRLGQYENRTIRVVLEELQKADVGRKFFKKDRRPLDPPPTVRLRIFEQFLSSNGGDQYVNEEEILALDGTYPGGWVCYAELFHAPNVPPAVASLSVSSSMSIYEQGQATTSMTVQEMQLTVAAQIEQTAAVPVLVDFTRRSASPMQISDGSPTYHSQYHVPPPTNPFSEQDSLAPLHNSVEFVPVRPNGNEMGENLTEQLAGSRFVQAIRMPVDGRDSLVFTFTDLSSKVEGAFVLRYRCFNVLSIAVGDIPRPVMAQCIGGPFEVFSTKSFPGLAESTLLSKSLAGAGIRTNKRETVRKGTNKGHDTTK